MARQRSALGCPASGRGRRPGGNVSSPGLKMVLVVARETVIRDLIPGRPRCDEARTAAGYQGRVERAEADPNFSPSGQSAPNRLEPQTEQKAFTRPSSGLKTRISSSPASRRNPSRGRVPRFRRRCPSAFCSANSGSDWPSETAPSPRSGPPQRHEPRSGLWGSALWPRQADRIRSRHTRILAWASVLSSDWLPSGVRLLPASD